MILSKNWLFVLLNFYFCFSVFNFIDFCFYLYCFFCYICFRFFVHFQFFEKGAQVIQIHAFLMWVFSAIHFFFSTALAVFHKFWYVVLLFSFSSVYIFTSLETFFLTMDYLETCYLFCKGFAVFVLIICSSLITFWSENTLYDFNS